MGDSVTVDDGAGGRRRVRSQAVTVYENRIPELQIINERFDAELSDILEAAELDDQQERALSRRFATEYQLITRLARLERIAADLVRHFVARGFLGKAMFVAIDKATAVRMYDLVAREWQTHLAGLEDRAGRLPPLERAGIDEQIAFMRETDTTKRSTHSSVGA
jgi:type I restriction enzyme R subunit